MDLFEKPRAGDAYAPLAHRMRPLAWDDFVGQKELLATLRGLVRPGGIPPSMLLWGPPGCGKTTLAHLVARQSGLDLAPFSAVTSGVADVRQVVALAKSRERPTIVFIDEIHRFNRAQQDAFLPHVENGTIVLVGATTENPSFEVTGPLLSRCRVFRLEALADAEVRTIADRAVAKESLQAGSDALDFIARTAGGDARVALNILEAAGREPVTLERAKNIAASKNLLYDKDREEHYNVVSALIKSLRGSDPDAALYWLARMLEAGEDPLFVARRLVIFASEDVGNADPAALATAVAAQQAAHFVGMPEAVLALAQATTYLASAPKSNASYVGYAKAAQDVRAERQEPVPLHLRNAVTPLMRDEGYGKGYIYPHDEPGGVAAQEYLPPNLRGRRYYEPKDSGMEIEIRKRLEEFRRSRTPPSPRKP